MKNSLMIRPLCDSDAESLYKMENEIWNPNNTPASISYPNAQAYLEDHSNQDTIVAVVDDLAVGSIDYHPATSKPASKYTWTFGIGVSPKFQSLGIGGQLLEHFKQFAKKSGVHKIHLRVLGTNPDAIQFYKKHGFEIEGILKDEFFLNGIFVADYQMAYFFK
ncbi:GNAT family N-acetyltransferase [Pediococcus ethanolidurans]|uniref:GNAT family N-acetyltransferase n=1 Tax=Pediococcus ethanolidurans TaxID=319653 RepID=UPI001C1EB11C|nr:GNAT family N-acetyltransferase [Pediococcus ethanolidurans]MBU7555490.1 GNAT family N-acetyltransferase [Pediococcus ethanolidurans]MBU7564228.1 GNAT family N-acetyltransferase [Pediococcus ethanolidurans]MCT4398458.1 GNAT family N-acetyltransferase [Pediococcus ethanolidurans]MCV3315883.1 GNAT family N-acetyltransferase [Pediococcus ethanolidurans]MCV3321916.1 GNAT family N-acetyltransferase [Pediococcus ethanolidurans]